MCHAVRILTQVTGMNCFIFFGYRLYYKLLRVQFALYHFGEVF